MSRTLTRLALSAVALLAPLALQAQPSAAATGRTRTALPAEQTAVFAGGCFWGIEGVFEHIKGVKSAVSGYAGGSGASPTYEQVSSGSSGHAEVVRVVFDPSQVSYEQLLHVFFSVAHDPTQLNRQGPDRGTQYRSAIFFTSDAQKRAAESYVAQLDKAKFFSRPIVTQITPLRGFFEAEEYHQDYMAHNPNAPYIVMHDAPKLEALRRQFPALYRER
jgi:peptide-methionine (S)-S-oxide reductase